ncbi:hypothetical protein TIFTF001_055163 [Ficus carica]|uniref:Uncharacterized protein n=1 Tax=Ficus carica TaxID=3494 RepID=A0AA88EB78_FICCA|nr:hypothetical protein TIFTF001_055163 [Ficus carica]
MMVMYHSATDLLNINGLVSIFIVKCGGVEDDCKGKFAPPTPSDGVGGHP